MLKANAVLLAAALVWLIPTQSNGQSMVQYGVAVGAGTVAGTAAGKQVSNGITAIFGKTAAAAAKAARQGEPASLELSDEDVRALRRRQAAEAERLRLEREAAARRYRAPARPVASARLEGASSSWMPTPIWLRGFTIAQPSAPVRAAVTPERLGDLARGLSRADVMGQLGAPVARVVIPEGNTINEVLYYQERGQTVGAVRLSGGAVTGVVVNAN
ncbi:MAG: hypothetical protein IPJ98_19765 [Bryobacterales bacterium]|nr:hypothetical protein [Bryobacterales bacterium]